MQTNPRILKKKKNPKPKSPWMVINTNIQCMRGKANIINAMLTELITSNT